MADYHRMSVAEKLKAHRSRMREEAIRCKDCGAQTTVADLLRHVTTTCSGRAEPHPLAKWVAWKEALALGVRAGTLSKWVRKGRVRTRGEVWRREYLLRDIVERVAEATAKLRELNERAETFLAETVSTRKANEPVDSDPGEGIEE